MTKRTISNTRMQLWVDAKVQGAIVRKVGLYWLACILFITIALVWHAAATDASQSLAEHFGSVMQLHWPVYVAMLSLLPLTMWDALRVSHRIAGPVLRIRQQLVRINNGEPFSKLEFRADDFWHDLTTQINQLTKKTLS